MPSRDYEETLLKTSNGKKYYFESKIRELYEKLKFSRKREMEKTKVENLP